MRDVGADALARDRRDHGSEHRHGQFLLWKTFTRRNPRTAAPFRLRCRTSQSPHPPTSWRRVTASSVGLPAGPEDGSLTPALSPAFHQPLSSVILSRSTAIARTGSRSRSRLTASPLRWGIHMRLRARWAANTTQDRRNAAKPTLVSDSAMLRAFPRLALYR